MRPWVGILLWVGAVGLAACGSDDEEAASALEAACQDYCDAAFSGCSVQGITADSCRKSCGYLETQLQGYCVTEYAAVFECGVAGGFTCTDNGPLPNDPCMEETQAWLTCTQEASCKRFCDAATAAGCPPGGSSGACISSCDATRVELDSCASSYDFYLQCAYTFGDLSCSGGKVTSTDCDEDLLDVGDCLATFQDPCAGYCFNSEALGCDDRAGCEASCNSARDSNPSCTSSYDDWLECVTRDWEPSCSGTELSAASCSYEEQQLQTCLGG